MKHLFIYILLFLNASIQAQSDYKAVDDIDAFNEKISAISKSTETLQCDFTQEKSLSFLDKKMISSGSLYFSSDEKLRWEYTSPYNYAILMANDQLVIIDEGEVNQTKMGNNPAVKNVQAMLTNTLKGDFSSQVDMFDQRVEESDDHYRITLVPKESAMKEFVSELQVYFTKQDFMASKFIMNENGDMTITEFSNQKINASLPDNIFEF